MQNQMKKSRGRQSTKKERKEDINMEATETKNHSPDASKKVIKLETKALCSSEKKIKKESSLEKKSLNICEKVTKQIELQKKSESSQSNLKINTQASIQDNQSGSNESSYSSSGLSNNSRTSKISKRSQRLIKSQRNKALKKILKKIKNQKKQYRLLDKIFSAKK